MFSSHVGLFITVFEVHPLMLPFKSHSEEMYTQVFKSPINLDGFSFVSNVVILLFFYKK